MSTDKNVYVGDEVAQGCPIEHPVLLEGDDNTEGKVIDIHTKPKKELDWDGAANNDMKVIAQRIWSLEKKLGLPGADISQAEYTPIAKTGATPPYTNPFGSQNMASRFGEADVNQPVGNVAHTAAGITHDEAIVRIDRLVQIIRGRLGVALNHASPPATLDNFAGTAKNGQTISGIPYPFAYQSKSTINEAIAMLDFVTKTKFNEVDDKFNEVDDRLDLIEKFLGIGITGLYVSPGGAGSQSGLDAGNAISGATAFGETGQINKTASGVKYILLPGTYTAFNLISSKGHTVILELQGATNFAAITASFNSAIVETGAFTLSSSAGIEAHTGSYIGIENNLIAATNVICENRAAIQCSGFITATAGYVRAENSAYIGCNNNITAGTMVSSIDSSHIRSAFGTLDCAAHVLCTSNSSIEVGNFIVDGNLTVYFSSSLLTTGTSNSSVGGFVSCKFSSSITLAGVAASFTVVGIVEVHQTSNMYGNITTMSATTISVRESTFAMDATVTAALEISNKGHCSFKNSGTPAYINVASGGFLQGTAGGTITGTTITVNSAVIEGRIVNATTSIILDGGSTLYADTSLTSPSVVVNANSTFVIVSGNIVNLDCTNGSYADGTLLASSSIGTFRCHQCSTIDRFTITSTPNEMISGSHLRSCALGAGVSTVVTLRGFCTVSGTTGAVIGTNVIVDNNLVII